MLPPHQAGSRASCRKTAAPRAVVRFSLPDALAKLPTEQAEAISSETLTARFSMRLIPALYDGLTLEAATAVILPALLEHLDLTRSAIASSRTSTAAVTYILATNIVETALLATNKILAFGAGFGRGVIAGIEIRLVTAPVDVSEIFIGHKTLAFNLGPFLKVTPFVLLLNTLNNTPAPTATLWCCGHPPFAMVAFLSRAVALLLAQNLQIVHIYGMRVTYLSPLAAPRLTTCM
jgi:hypothetical protein